MTAYSGGSGRGLFGQGDTAPVAREFASLFPPGSVQAATEVTNPTNTVLSESHVLVHSHEHSTYNGDVHTHSHEHQAVGRHDHHEQGDGLSG